MRLKTILALAAALLAIRTARHYYVSQRCPKPPLRKLRGSLYRDAPATTFGLHSSCDSKKKFGRLALAAIRRHPWYARRRCPADLVLVCINTPEELLRLPPRAGKYVVWMLGVRLDSCVWEFTERCLDWYNVFSTRSDFLYASLDLGDHRLCDDAHGALPGSVMIERTLGPAIVSVVSTTRPTLFSFAGQKHQGWYGSSRARPDLFEAYDAWRAAGGDGRRVTITERRLSMRNYTALLRDSRFGLAPRGDGRWTWRFVELLRFGTIHLRLRQKRQSAPGVCIGIVCVPRGTSDVNQRNVITRVHTAL